MVPTYAFSYRFEIIAHLCLHSFVNYFGLQIKYGYSHKKSILYFFISLGFSILPWLPLKLPMTVNLPGAMSIPITIPKRIRHIPVRVISEELQSPDWIFWIYSFIMSPPLSISRIIIAWIFPRSVWMVISSWHIMIFSRFEQFIKSEASYFAICFFSMKSGVYESPLPSDRRDSNNVVT